MAIGIGLALFVVFIIATWLLRPRLVLALIQSLSKKVLFYVKTKKTVIALTIDDVPDRETIPLILDVLDENDAKATFFIISNQIDGNEEILESIVKAGHELGNHTTQDSPSILRSPNNFKADLLEAGKKISAFAPVQWFRPASGFYHPCMIKIAEEANYQTALGDVFPLDTLITSVDFAAKYIMRNIQPGSIIVLHDNSHNEQQKKKENPEKVHSRGERAIKTLEIVLPKLQAQKYTVTTLSELKSFSST